MHDVAANGETGILSFTLGVEAVRLILSCVYGATEGNVSVYGTTPLKIQEV